MFSIFIYFSIFFLQKYKQTYWRLKAQLDAFQHSFILKLGQSNLLPSILTFLFINCSEFIFEGIICHQIRIQTQQIWCRHVDLPGMLCVDYVSQIMSRANHMISHYIMINMISHSHDAILRYNKNYAIFQSTLRAFYFA